MNTLSLLNLMDSLIVKLFITRIAKLFLLRLFGIYHKLETSALVLFMVANLSIYLSTQLIINTK